MSCLQQRGEEGKARSGAAGAAAAAEGLACQYLQRPQARPPPYHAGPRPNPQCLCNSGLQRCSRMRPQRATRPTCSPWQWAWAATPGRVGLPPAAPLRLLAPPHKCSPPAASTPPPPPSMHSLTGLDLEALARNVDWFNVMTYDLHAAWCARACMRLCLCANACARAGEHEGAAPPSHCAAAGLPC